MEACLMLYSRMDGGTSWHKVARRAKEKTYAKEPWKLLERRKQIITYLLKDNMSLRLT